MRLDLSDPAAPADTFELTPGARAPTGTALCLCMPVHMLTAWAWAWSLVLVSAGLWRAWDGETRKGVTYLSLGLSRNRGLQLRTLSALESNRRKRLNTGKSVWTW